MLSVGYAGRSSHSPFEEVELSKEPSWSILIGSLAAAAFFCLLKLDEAPIALPGFQFSISQQEGVVILKINGRGTKDSRF